MIRLENQNLWRSLRTRCSRVYANHGLEPSPSCRDTHHGRFSHDSPGKLSAKAWVIQCRLGSGRMLPAAAKFILAMVALAIVGWLVGWSASDHYMSEPCRHGVGGQVVAVAGLSSGVAGVTAGMHGHEPADRTHISTWASTQVGPRPTVSCERWCGTGPPGAVIRTNTSSP